MLCLPDKSNIYHNTHIIAALITGGVYPTNKTKIITATIINKLLNIIGKNFNISHEVTIGQHNRGKYKGTPIIGDNVYIGPGAKIFGNIRIGNNVAIGANAVVTKSIPDYSVAVGIPAKIVSSKGTTDFNINLV